MLLAVVWVGFFGQLWLMLIFFFVPFQFVIHLLSLQLINLNWILIFVFFFSFIMSSSSSWCSQHSSTTTATTTTVNSYRINNCVVYIENIFKFLSFLDFLHSFSFRQQLSILCLFVKKYDLDINICRHIKLLKIFLLRFWCVCVCVCFFFCGHVH